MTTTRRTMTRRTAAARTALIGAGVAGAVATSVAIGVHGTAQAADPTPTASTSSTGTGSTAGQPVRPGLQAPAVQPPAAGSHHRPSHAKSSGS